MNNPPIDPPHIGEDDETPPPSDDETPPPSDDESQMPLKSEEHDLSNSKKRRRSRSSSSSSSNSSNSSNSSSSDSDNESNHGISRKDKRRKKVPRLGKEVAVNTSKEKKIANTEPNASASDPLRNPVDRPITIHSCGYHALVHFVLPALRGWEKTMWVNGMRQ